MYDPTIVVALIGVAVVVGKTLTQAASHGRIPNNGLSSQIRENAPAISALSKNHTVVVQHQRGPDRRRKAVPRETSRG